jgi:lysophospholipase L1-like esterase
MGNRLLFDYHKRFVAKALFGIGGLNRLERDVLNYSDCEYVILALGTNDFLQYGTIAAPKSQKPTVEQFFEGVLELKRRLDEKGIKLIVFNILNFGESIDSRPEKEDMVKRFNELLMKEKALFHGVYDQASLVVNPEKPNCTDKKYLGKDYIHPNLEGGKIVAENIDLDMFR